MLHGRNRQILGLVAFIGLALLLAATAVPAQAATLGNLSGQSCGDFSGTWHFVNNQTGGAPAGSLSASWSSGDTCTVSASKVLSSTQHFYCIGSGTLLGASTNLPGKLVLSDFSCDTKTPPPPPCDPKTQICK
jgi:hypothetical protein